jgi:hypothetical protein
MRRTFAVIAFVLLTVALVPPATAQAAGLEAIFTPGGEPLDLTPQTAKNSFPDNGLVLPFYVVDTDRPGGVTTLFAVRNRLDSDVVIDLVIFDEDGVATSDTSELLRANGTRSVNLRDVLQADTGLRAGIVIASVAVSEEDPSQALTGDYFIVDPSNNSADGDTLSNIDTAFCESWDIRFLNGGPFNGGTSLRVATLENAPSIGSTLLEGNVYDEAGDFMGNINIVSNGSAVGDIDVSTINGLTAFGSMELSFDNEDGGGAISIVHTALNRYSIGMKGFCTDAPILVN